MADLLKAVQTELERLPSDKRESLPAVLALDIAEKIELRPGFRDYVALVRILLDTFQQIADMPSKPYDEDDLRAYLETVGI